MLLSELARTSDVVSRSPARSDKIAVLADLLTRVPESQIAVAVAFLSGELTQRQIGVGYAALADLLDPSDFGLAPVGDDPGTGTPLPGEPRSASAEHAAHDQATHGQAAAAPHDQVQDARLPHDQEPGALSLAQADEQFEAIGSLLGPRSQARRRELLADLLGRATTAERRFLIRLLTGDLRQGALAGVMTESVACAAGVPASDVRRAHQLRGSLPEVARAALTAAARGASRQEIQAILRAFTLKVGQPVRPMLAASAPDIGTALTRISPAGMEWKIDGIRIQIHRNGSVVRIFTRTLDDITERVPELVRIGLNLNATTAVVDGEAVALRPDGRPYPFQVTSARAASRPAFAPATSGEPSRTSKEPALASGGPSAAAPAETGPDRAQTPMTPPRREHVPLTAFLFDLLHIDGEDLIDRPADERAERLAAIVPTGTLIPRQVTADPGAAERFFRDALDHGHEGVVVKSLQAPYGAGRRGKDWIKVKPRSTLDLVVLAAEWGHGRRAGLLSNLHLGARDQATGRYVMLGKTFKGLTDAMLAWQTGELLARADPPYTRTASGQPHGVVRVRPELVAEIAFDGVQASRRYPGGVTLRFARVLRYRTDKRAEEADTIDAVRALWTGDSADALPRAQDPAR